MEEKIVKRATGCFKDGFDERDYIYMPVCASHSNLPDSFILERFPVKDQGDINSCVAHSCALIKEIQEFYDTGKKLEFSVGWIYGYRTSGQYMGESMSPTDALKTLIDYGDVVKSVFPENLEYDDIQGLIDKRKATCIQKAKPFVIKAYARVTSAMNVKTAIYNNHSPVMIVVDIYENFYNIPKTGIVPNRQGSCDGGHAMVIIGWTKINNQEYYVVQNSWGTNWGDKGLCYIKPGNSIISDLFTSVDKTNTIQDMKRINYK